MKRAKGDRLAVGPLKPSLTDTTLVFSAIKTLMKFDLAFRCFCSSHDNFSWYSSSQMAAKRMEVESNVLAVGGNIEVHSSLQQLTLLSYELFCLVLNQLFKFRLVGAPG